MKRIVCTIMLVAALLLSSAPIYAVLTFPVALMHTHDVEVLSGEFSEYYDGTGDYYQITQAHSGSGFAGLPTASKKCIVVFTIDMVGGGSVNQAIAQGYNGFSINRGNFATFGNGTRIVGRNTAGTIVFDILTYSGVTTEKKLLDANGWQTFFLSWDSTGTAEYHVYIDNTGTTQDVSSTTTVLTNDGEIDFSAATDAGGNNFYRWGKIILGTDLDAYLSNIYVAYDQFIDFSILANRRKFVNVDGIPLYLGADGSNPTGVAPHIYSPTGNLASDQLGTFSALTAMGDLPTQSPGPNP